MKNKKCTLIRIGGNAKGNVVRNIKAIGDFNGIDISDNAQDNFVTNVQIISVAAITAIQDLKTKVNHLAGLDEAVKTTTLEYLDTIARTGDKTATYTKMMEFLSAHITVFTPLLPALMSLGSLLQ